MPGSAGTSFDQFTFVLQYQDAAGNWITYDVKYPDLHSQGPGTAIVNIADDPGQTYQSPLRNNQISANDVVFDPRTARFGVGITSQLGNVPRANGIAYTLEPLANSTFFDNSPAGLTKMGNTLFTVFETDRPRVDPGDQVYYSNPCMTFDPGQNLQMRWFGGPEYRASSGTGTSPVEYDGLFSQNNPAIQSTILSQNGAATQQLFYEDPDGVARRATGAYADTTLAGSTVGLPLATANTFNNNAVGTTNAQSQSRPLILNRPFRSVAEMSYAFSGTPWKNIDFFTPESGSSALLDVFCGQRSTAQRRGRRQGRSQHAQCRRSAGRRFRRVCGRSGELERRSAGLRASAAHQYGSGQRGGQAHQHHVGHGTRVARPAAKRRRAGRAFHRHAGHCQWHRLLRVHAAKPGFGPAHQRDLRGAERDARQLGLRQRRHAADPALSRIGHPPTRGVRPGARVEPAHRRRGADRPLSEDGGRPRPIRRRRSAAPLDPRRHRPLHRPGDRQAGGGRRAVSLRNPSHENPSPPFRLPLVPIALLAATTAAFAQSVRPEPPDGALLKEAPDGTKWVVTFSYPQDRTKAAARLCRDADPHADVNQGR
ncbi:MAG: hypothetical protein WDO13_08540 [Verrucomicrobiota bacterium]